MSTAFATSQAAQAPQPLIPVPQPDAIQQLPIAIALVAWPFLLVILGQTINTLFKMTEPSEPAYIELNGTAIMMKIEAALEDFGPDNPPPAIWIGSKAYYRILSASMDRNWKFKDQFDNEKARIFGIGFIVNDEYGDTAICYAP